MTLPEHLGHYLRVGLATFFTRIAVRETFQSKFLHLRVLLWWAASVVIVIAAIVEGVRIQRREQQSK